MLRRAVWLGGALGLLMWGCGSDASSTFEESNAASTSSNATTGGMGGKADTFGWQGNEMTKVDRDIMVLANPEIANLPNWVIALVAAGGLAAALSADPAARRSVAPSLEQLLAKAAASADHPLHAFAVAGQMGYASALAWLLFAVVFVFVFIQMRVFQSRRIYDE